MAGSATQMVLISRGETSIRRRVLTVITSEVCCEKEERMRKNSDDSLHSIRQFIKAGIRITTGLQRQIAAIAYFSS